jgi:hypothetical protein
MEQRLGTKIVKDLLNRNMTAIFHRLFHQSNIWSGRAFWFIACFTVQLPDAVCKKIATKEMLDWAVSLTSLE